MAKDVPIKNYGLSLPEERLVDEPIDIENLAEIALDISNNKTSIFEKTLTNLQEK